WLYFRRRFGFVFVIGILRTRHAQRRYFLGEDGPQFMFVACEPAAAAPAHGRALMAARAASAPARRAPVSPPASCCSRRSWPDAAWVAASFRCPRPEPIPAT